mmetsp:Transcript_19029/g.34440  ORF Transcript_19029/g.34440 Transcript_19029/m.34440 type:complete len:290 (-) Transcript_19029:2573-3442(-)
MGWAVLPGPNPNGSIRLAALAVAEDRGDDEEVEEASATDWKYGKYEAKYRQPGQAKMPSPKQSDPHPREDEAEEARVEVAAAEEEEIEAEEDEEDEEHNEGEIINCRLLFLLISILLPSSPSLLDDSVNETFSFRWVLLSTFSLLLIWLLLSLTPPFPPLFPSPPPLSFPSTDDEEAACGHCLAAAVAAEKAAYPQIPLWARCRSRALATIFKDTVHPLGTNGSNRRWFRRVGLESSGTLRVRSRLFRLGEHALMNSMESPLESARARTISTLSRSKAGKDWKQERKSN